MIVNIKVKASSSQEKINRLSNNKYEVWLRAKPINNKANMELLKLLKKYFKRDVKIKSGLTSKKKIIEVIND